MTVGLRSAGNTGRHWGSAIHDEGSIVRTVTLLLGDVEGSTRMWEADRVRAREAMRFLDAVVDQATSRHGGERPLEQGEGDSFIVAFARPGSAAACALEIQRALADGPEALRVRVALHSGDVEVRPDGRYVGPVFNRCARLRSLAAGGQTLMTGPTHDLCVDELPEGAATRELGLYALRDLERPERVFQLGHVTLDDEFPEIKHGARSAHNLPTAMTSFVGRDEEVAVIADLLDEHRIVTLTGPGGAGKTRLSLEVAARTLARFPDGAWFVDLGPIDDFDLVPSVVGRTLGIEEVGHVAVTDRLVDALRSRELLVVLDNCEHVIDACAELAETLVGRCPGVIVLATSREPLKAAGEATYRVPSLRTPDTDAVDLTDLSDQPAMRLFVDRARLRGVTLVDEDGPAIARICAQVDGLPLAIELAAARVGVLRPAEIADSLDDRFALLTGGARTALERQRTLEGSVDWSYDLLDDDERRALTRLSVAAGTFDLDTATAVIGEEGGPVATLDLLTSLVDKSLVVSEPALEGSVSRYRLLQTIRAYAARRLIDGGDASATRDRHLAHFVALAEHAEPALTTVEFSSWNRRLDLDLDNFRAAMSWALATGQVEAALRVLGSLLRWFVTRAMYTEIRSTLVAALEESRNAEPRIRARALATAAGVTLIAGDWGGVRALADECIALADECGDDETLATGLAYRGWLATLAQGGGREDLEQAVDVARRCGDPATLCRALRYLGWQASCAGDRETGLPALLESVDLAEEGGDQYASAVARVFLGTAMLLDGRLDDADDHMCRAIDELEAVGSHVFMTPALGVRAVVAAQRGEVELARSFLRRARDLDSEDDGAGSWHVGRYGFHAAHVRALVGDVDESIDEELERTRVAWEAQPILSGSVSLAMAAAAIGRGQLDRAREVLEAAIEVARRTQAHWYLAQLLHELARVERRSGVRARSLELHHEELALLVDLDAAADTADTLEGLAGLAVDAEDDDHAARLFGAAATIRDDAGRLRRGFRRWAEADLTACRERAGDDRFAAAYVAGGELTWDEAIAWARRGRGARGRPTAGWDGLSPVELDVARRVAAGMSNPEVAEALFISRNTVKTHLQRIYQKLAIGSRAELAAIVERNQPDAGRPAGN